MKHLLPLLALLATTACTDRDGMPDVVAPVGTLAAFTFRLPSITAPGASDATAGLPDHDAEVVDAAAASQQSTDSLPREIRDILEGRQSLITHPPEADVAFLPDEGVVFGQALGQSIGTWHRNTVTLTLYLDNRPIAEAVGFETSGCANCFRFHRPHGRIANATLPVQRSCGLAAQARALLETKLEATYDKTVLLANDDGTATARAAQPTCPPARGGGGGEADDEQWYLCHWEAYFNELGDLIYQRDLGCVSLTSMA